MLWLETTGLLAASAYGYTNRTTTTTTTKNQQKAKGGFDLLARS
jgi:hypothetical protein